MRGAFLGPWELQNYSPLIGKGVKVTAFSSHHPLNGKIKMPLRKLWSPLDLPPFPYKMPVLNRFLGDAHYLWRLENELRGFDIAHSAETYYYYTQQCLEAKKRGWVKRVISTVWETIPFNNEGIRRRKKFKRRAYQEVDLFLTPTQRAADALRREGVQRGKIRVVPMGVDKIFFGKKAPREKDKKTLHLLFVGRLVVEKGIWDLLWSFQQLIRKGFSLNLWLVGEGPEKAKIIRWLRSNGLLRFAKIKKMDYWQMPLAYRWADIFVLPSLHTRYWEEQYGMAAVEALAAGLPVVVSDSGSLPEVVGQAGLVVPEGRKESLAETLELLAAKPRWRRHWSSLARRRAVDRYFAPKVADELLAIYTSLLSDG